MTNLLKLSGIIAISAFFIVLTGCKKDEESAIQFTITGDTSYHFEYDQKVDVSYKTLRIKKFNEPEMPEGWSCTRSSGKFTITAPSKTAVDAGTAETSGIVKVSAVSETDVTLSREITVSIKLATEIEAQANSFIVSEPGVRYKFNALHRGNETAETFKNTAAHALRIWSTSKTALTNVSYRDGFIYFALADDTTLESGNALIGLTDKDNNVLWSWHIWITDFNPDEAPDNMGGMRVMNRNLGAFANSNATPQELCDSYGLYYQWGRKDPFLGPGAWDSSSTRTMYNAQGNASVYAYVKSTAETGTVEWSISHPVSFIAGAADNSDPPKAVNDFDWLFSGHRTDLWSVDSKTIYDPCPDGWRVAPPTIWTSFTNGGTKTEDPSMFNVEENVATVFDNTDADKGNDWYGWTFKNGDNPVFYPAAGRRSFSPSMAVSTKNFSNIVNDARGNGLPVGFYWSSKHPGSSASGGGSLAFTATYDYDAADNKTIKYYLNPGYSSGSVPDNAPAGGFPLRCVKM